jgi:ABC-type uncharacterized transport system involved in gliding motility auxiliary subunit
MKRPVQTLVFSTVGVVAVFLILLAVNIIAGHIKVRADLTQERAFTLSNGTRAILKKLDAPVHIRLYVTQGPGMPVELRNYATQIEDILDEYRQASPQIKIQKLDTEPDSDAADSAALDGVQPIALPNGDAIYLGLSVTMLDRKEAIPFLSPQRERLLEYDISRAITQVTMDKKPVVGVLSPLPVFGGFNPLMMRMGMRGSPEWTFAWELKRDFAVKEIQQTVDAIPDDVEVLIVIQPRDIPELLQYAIDQFVLRGGKLIAFVDPLCVFDSQGGMGAPPEPSTLDKLFAAWGVTFDTHNVVADLDYMAETERGRQPAILALNSRAFNHDDVVTSDIDSLVMLFAGAFTGHPADGLTKTDLVTSSANAQLIGTAKAELPASDILPGFDPSGEQYPLAIRLTGKFKTAFPGGKPAQPDEQNQDGDQAEKVESPATLTESASENTVILVADADMIQDPAAVRELPNALNQAVLVPANGNLSFGQSAVEQLAGDSNLIAVRSRASRERPFTVVRQMQARAEERYRSSIQNLETELRQTEEKLTALQQTRRDGQASILSPEQQQEVVNFQKREAEVRQQLKQVRRNLAAEIDSLETRLKWFNIALMPAVVAVVGLVLFLLKRKRSAAR